MLSNMSQPAKSSPSVYIPPLATLRQSLNRHSAASKNNLALLIHIIAVRRISGVFMKRDSAMRI